MAGLGEKRIEDLTSEEYDIFTTILDHIKINPVAAKALFDFIEENYPEESEQSLFNLVLEACQNIEIELDHDNFILEASEDNWRSFDILQTASCNSCLRANIYLPANQDLDENSNDHGWCRGEGVTKEQREFLSSLGIQYIKWCKPVGGSYLPTSINYKKVSTLVTVEAQSKHNNTKEVAVAVASMMALVALVGAGRPRS